MVELVHDIDFLKAGIEDQREYLALERLLLFARSQAENLDDPALAALCREAADRCARERLNIPADNSA